MKNKFIYIYLIFLFLVCDVLAAEELQINATKIQYDDNKKITVFKGSVDATDSKNNKLLTNYAEYNKTSKTLETQGLTEIITSQGYNIKGTNILFDNKKKIISSLAKTEIIDKDGNKISLDMFNYFTEKNIFFSKGKVEVLDVNNNKYSFSEIYIDEIKKKMVGSDVKAFLNSQDIIINESNEPRFFANTCSVTSEQSTFNKGVFTYCKNRKDNKPPPWKIQSKKIEHNSAKKTIYYDNAILKVYDFPIFFFPKFSHPDPTVKRRSGFLVPSLSNSSTVGSGFNIPYFWGISKDKDLTVTPKIYLNENPVILAEFRQDFENSFLIVDTSFTQGYKNKTDKKSSGSRAHFFTRFTKSIIDEGDKNSNIEVNIQRLSNDTYFKIHDINSTLVKQDTNILSNTLDYTYQDKDLFFGSNASVFEDTSKLDRTRWEYSVPITFEKNLFTDDQFGNLSFASNVRIRNYDVNKRTDLLVNDFKWDSKKWINNLGFENHFESLIKATSYRADNTIEFKTDNANSELSGVVGFFSKLNLYKNDVDKGNIYSLTPKMMTRYAPGHMRRIKGGRLKYSNLFDLTKVSHIDVIENGFSTTLGFDFKKNDYDLTNGIGKEKFSFSAGQVISEEENKDIPSTTSLDQRFSDIVGVSSYNINDNIGLKYNFAIDQGYKELNYSEIGADMNFGKTKFNVSYLEEKNHIGNQEYIQSGIDLELNNSTALSFSAKRNILTSSAEYYNINYEYFNDCLRAGIAYRRSFYADRDVESTNSLMFKVTFVPFGEISSPTFPNAK